MRYALQPHLDSRSQFVTEITVDVARPEPAIIELCYRAAGDISGLRIPKPAASEHRDGLWRQTCFEAFLRARKGDAYAEFNFSPSTAFAVYEFSGYRAGMSVMPGAAPVVRVERSAQQLEIRVTAPLPLIPHIDIDGPLLVGLTAIIEDANGDMSWWALAHPAGKPDFHHRDGFVLPLPEVSV